MTDLSPAVALYTYRVNQVLRVIDGDTIVVSIDLGFHISLTQTIRIKGIDAPEARTSNQQEKVLGLAAKAFVENWVQNKRLLITTTKDDKYGRMLGDIICDKTKDNLFDVMISAGHAKVYVNK